MSHACGVVSGGAQSAIAHRPLSAAAGLAVLSELRLPLSLSVPAGPERGTNL